MGKGNKKGIHVKPDKLVGICFSGGGGAGREGSFPEQAPKCKL